MLSSSRTTFVRLLLLFIIVPFNLMSSPQPGLISQVAEELWEVADKTIKNLTKREISIIDYKKNLIKQSALFLERANCAAEHLRAWCRLFCDRKGEIVLQDCAKRQDIEKT